MLPPESFTETCGCVVNAAPEAVPTDARTIDSDAAAPVVTETDWVAEVTEPDEYVTVYAVLAVPEIPRSVKVATPFTTVAVVVPTRVAPEDTDAVTTVELSLVTTLPPASVIET